jgi:alkyldihydroxyacetonephosphate synthase
MLNSLPPRYQHALNVQGTYTKQGAWPRISSGPDLNHIVIGQEGNYGLVTEAVVKIRKLPEVKKYGSVIFPDMESGIKFMEQAGRQGIWAASMRLMDNL